MASGLRVVTADYSGFVEGYPDSLSGGVISDFLLFAGRGRSWSCPQVVVAQRHPSFNFLRKTPFVKSGRFRHRVLKIFTEFSAPAR
jgi:hypothetical protein